MLVGTVVLCYGAYESILAISNIFYGSKSGEKIISLTLKSLDLIFLGIVIQIMGIGLFELFVKPIELLPDWLIIKNFDELKVLLVKASITVITISFVGRAVTWSGDENIVYYGVGIGAIIAALSYFIKVKSK